MIVLHIGFWGINNYKFKIIDEIVSIQFTTSDSQK